MTTGVFIALPLLAVAFLTLLGRFFTEVEEDEDEATLGHTFIAGVCVLAALIACGVSASHVWNDTFHPKTDTIKAEKETP